MLGLLAAARGEDGEHLDATELRDQVLIFLLAGHETTATSLTFALHLLGKHPTTGLPIRDPPPPGPLAAPGALRPRPVHPGTRGGPAPLRLVPLRGGPRSCIGQHFSMLESVLGLATLLRAFEVEAVDPEVLLGQGMTLEARGPVRIKLTTRERAPELVTSP